jgi:hypothetical protein
MNHQAKVKAAMDYLKARGIYVLDGKFQPTSSAATDVAKTIERYRAQTMGSRPLRAVKVVKVEY